MAVVSVSTAGARALNQKFGDKAKMDVT